MPGEQREQRPTGASSTDAGANRAQKLTILPSGDAIRASTVQAVRIVRDEGPLATARPLYSVVVFLDDDETIDLAVKVSYSEAKQAARAAAQIINKALGV